MSDLIKISPSILSADFSKLGSEVISLEKAGADYIHIDVMDGSFVPNITIGPSVISKIRPFSKKPFDVHLENEAKEAECVEQITNFLSEYVEIYEELTEMKIARDKKQNRTTIGADSVYPEEADRNIMAIVKLLASQSLEGLGSILIATRDGDFTLTARAFEERFGYGIIKNSKMLNTWLS